MCFLVQWKADFPWFPPLKGDWQKVGCNDGSSRNSCRQCLSYDLVQSIVFSPCIMCVQYIGGIPWVHWGDIMSTSGCVQYIGRYHEYIRGISWVHRGISWCIRGIPWIHWGGDIMSTSRDVQYIGVFNRNWKVFINLLPQMWKWYPPMYWTSLMYSWYPPM